MTVTVRSFAKINLGLRIGPTRTDGFHELRTVYQTITLHDVLRLEVVRGSGIDIRCADPRVPTDETNTCFPILARGMSALKARGKVILEIEKRLPVQSGLGGASGNAVAALLGLERALKRELPGPERLRLAGEVGSDLPLFLIGGTVLGVGHGEEVYPLPDLPPTPCLVATPEVGISTPQAFADWDAQVAAPRETGDPRSASTGEGACRLINESRTKLTPADPSDRITEFSRVISAWLSNAPLKRILKGRLSGVPAAGRGRAETLLLDLVRTGIENDFEQVVFPQYPELRDVKRVLVGEGAYYASLSGSGSTVYGLFRRTAQAAKAAASLRKLGMAAQTTSTVTRAQYWSRLQVSGF